MNFEVIPTPDFEKSFKRLAKRHRSLKADFSDFTKELKQNPFQGDELTPGIRKIRMAISSKGKGKSGGARVITYTVVALKDEGDVMAIKLGVNYNFNSGKGFRAPRIEKNNDGSRLQKE